jgi:UDP-glucose 4-epimerase
MKSLIVGGNGFIGTHLISALLRGGHRVSVYDRTPPRTDFDWHSVQYFHSAQADPLTRRRLLKDCDCVYYLASTTVPSTSNSDPPADIEENLVTAVRFLDEMLEAGCKRIVYFSSGGTVYGVPTSTGALDEGSPTEPICSYGIVKLAVEKYLLMYQQLHGLVPTILRPSNPYGPRQAGAGVQGLVAAAMSRILSGQPLEVWGDGRSVRDYVCVTDIADLAVQAAASGEAGVFNASSGVGVSILDLVSAVQRVTGRRLDLVFRPARGFDVPHIILSRRRAEAKFGWVPRVNLEDGLKDTWEWFRQRPNH